MNATLTTHEHPVERPSDSDTYPPTLSETVRELAHELLRTVKPGLNIQTTWLAYRDSTLPPDAEPNRHSAPLIDSLIEYFTGCLTWTSNEVLGFYPSPATTALTPAIEPLGRAAILTLYAQVNQQLEQRHSQKLADYWAVELPDGKTRSSALLADRIQCLKSECEIQIALGQMKVSHHSMLSAALKLSATNTTDEVQPHSVYSLSASIGGGEPMPLHGAFAITRRLRTQPAQTEEEEREDVLLFTLQDGLEGFSSFKQMNDSLIRQGADPQYRKSVQAQLTPEEPGPPITSPLQWHYSSMTGNFLSTLLTRQIIRQQSIFAHAIQRARAERMDMTCIEQLIWRLLSPELNFDNHLHLDRLNSELIQTHMPDWWKTMGQEQRKQWLEHAQRFGEAVVKIQRSSKETFASPEDDSRIFLARYIDQQLDNALKKAAITLAPERIRVSITYLTTPEVLEIQEAPITQDSLTATMSLKELVHTADHRNKVEYATQTNVTDDKGAAITHLDERFITELITTIKDPQHLGSYLDLHLKSSTYAHQLKRSQKDLLESQMRMAVLEIEQQAFPLKCLSWINAVLDSPGPEKRRTVDGEKIEVRFFSVNQLKMTNVMLIAPVDTFEKGPIVLCTLDATDGVVFRWFSSMYLLNINFLEKEPFQRYLLQQIPFFRRLETLQAMQYEKEAKHWRLPEVLTRFSPIPFPIKLLRLIAFIPQSEDLYEENNKTKIDQLIQTAKRQMSPEYQTGQSDSSFDLIANIAILFLPDAIMMPLALGVGLYKTWSAFEKLEENDIEGAAEEFLSAIGYLAIAAMGRMALPLKSAIKARKAVRRPNLIRRTGRDGQAQIGYLMSHSSAPKLADSGLTVPLDHKRFVAVEIDAKTWYVSRRANMFGHSRLYRVHPTDLSTLVHEEEYALRTTSGAWKIVGNKMPRLSQTATQQAKTQLTNLLSAWPASLQDASGAERVQFEADYLALSKTSNAEDLAKIVAYAEGGSADINPLLRRGVRNAKTREFMSQFHHLREWNGSAFRATYVSSAGLACLEQEGGAVFTDAGIQSASVSRANAASWSQDVFVSGNASSENHPVFFIFAPSIPKKNLFTGFLGDHVAIAPGTHLQLCATKRLNGQLFAYFDVPERIADETYDLYTGEKESWV
ncbi:hypothetical protein A249_00855 [Pseudomonas syringae pv. actinidiae ICMP 18804]|uniref:Uncharacterized protein n=4 Tax=Pseudomonas syringae TaxID=317 RepID=A0A3M4K6H4_PSESF|nr:DUF6543 domain-containing protein [Pseudomonas syringae]EPN22194.1 hypothetical protein A248_00535 [Pseudomonas syringae pv. actinidiae ICMP 19100]EPN24301.1 hypothetical protein A249_00855 [Pseudomonas syringae pv. actinidiae ICMP 18804]EPN29579.1 hypothetical protein A247_00540 [Pseudomonas syringae pv. actinidiae ICMP 19099]EPN46423.1 hypothetical protein A242_00560 [Pseudomonas syringae pv. actinidiae ICMP 19095]EPN47764.1 hypothetical protein A241_27226 [Pseudomonas syringae pv. actini